MKNKKLLFLGVSALVLFTHRAEAVEVSSLTEINALMKQHYAHSDGYNFVLKGDANNEIHSGTDESLYTTSIGTIQGNNVTLVKSDAFSGVSSAFIYNTPYSSNYNSWPTLNILDVNFENGDRISDGDDNIRGGALVNMGSHYEGELEKAAQIDNLKGNFTNNFVRAENGDAWGGAIYQRGGNINNLQGDFKGNYAQTISGNANGGVISNAGTIGCIEGNFDNNYVKSDTGAAFGGGISGFWNGYLDMGFISSIHGNFRNNYAKSESSAAFGGAIFDFIPNVQGEYPVTSLYNSNFIGNSVETGLDDASKVHGGAIYTTHDLQISAVNGESIFSGNKVIYKDEAGNTVEDNEAIYIGNGEADDWKYLTAFGADEDLNYSFDDILHQSGYESSPVTVTLNATNGGLIKFDDKIRAIVKENIVDSEKILSSKIEDFDQLRMESDGKQGFNLYRDNGDLAYHVFSIDGKYFIPGEKDVVAFESEEEKNEFMAMLDEIKSAGFLIHQDGTFYLLDIPDEGIIGVNMEENGYDMQLYSVHTYSSHAANLVLKGDASSTIELNNSIENLDIISTAENVRVSEGQHLNHNNSLTINGGNINITDLGDKEVHFAALNLNEGSINIDQVSADLAAKEMGRITADEVAVGTGVINVNNIVLTTEAEDKVTAVEFANEKLRDAVQTTVVTAEKAIAPIYKYDVVYDDTTGEFVFTRPEEQVSENFNPGAYAGSVSALSNLNMQAEAVTQVSDLASRSVLDYNKGRVWALPFYSNDTVGYSGFYDVDSRNYGLLAGVDSKAYHYGANGLSGVYTIFGGYNDGQNKYDGVKVDDKSWMLGLKASLYQNGFYGDAIVDYAKHDMDAKTVFGTDSNDTYGYGAALRVGYKHQIQSLSLDGSIMLNWQHIAGEDYRSKSGTMVDVDDYSWLVLTPQLKIGYELDRVLRPYALVRYNVMMNEKGRSRVNDVLLPAVESKDYVEYGFGLESDDMATHSGYAHILRRDGGREGWAVTAGYKFNF